MDIEGDPSPFLNNLTTESSKEQTVISMPENSASRRNQEFLATVRGRLVQLGKVSIQSEQ